jgi:ABC-type lipoprotein export system ATPase subunit
MELIKKFHEETKTTVIVITHNQEVARYAERQIVLEDGVVVDSNGVLVEDVHVPVLEECVAKRNEIHKGGE